ncbi:MAG: hypothetical protein LBJ70_02940 [Holosporales bacterium]|nr:hypothetical protein [Holosporales bacterium]
MKRERGSLLCSFDMILLLTSHFDVLKATLSNLTLLRFSLLQKPMKEAGGY